MTKGDAARNHQRRRDEFTKKYKVGDIAFSPIYGIVKIIKMNKITATCHQVNKDGTSRSLLGKDRMINIDKGYFKW
jgi:hypothetical protein